MPARDRPRPLTALGLSPAQERLYRALLRVASMSPESAAEVLGAPEGSPDYAEAVDDLVSRGLVLHAIDDLVAAPPARALALRLEPTVLGADQLRERLAAVQDLLPELEAEHRTAREERTEHVELQAIDRQQVVPTLQTIALETTGELRWLRPQHWVSGAAGDRWIGQLLAGGRRSRAIYPARALEEAPVAVRRRAERGEHVRVLGSVPGRLALIGDVAALVPRSLGPGDDVILVVRQRALVDSLIWLFESLWERALVVPGLPGDGDTVSADEGARRLLLEQLARGAKDEQIARTLGLSLRTVRRRVADLMDDLGAGSRFQAGVEAVRRGWI